MTGRAGLRGLTASHFTAVYKHAVECGIADSLSSAAGVVACDQVNITSVNDDLRRRRGLRDAIRSGGSSVDLSRHMHASSVSGVQIAFMMRVLLEELGLSRADGVDVIKSRLSTAQASGELTAKTNQMLSETLGSGNFTALSVDDVDSVGDAVFDVLRTAAPSLQPPTSDNSSRHGSNIETLFVALGAALGGVALFGIAVVMLTCRRANKQQQNVHAISAPV
jgi:hypothetical protein